MLEWLDAFEAWYDRDRALVARDAFKAGYEAGDAAQHKKLDKFLSSGNAAYRVSNLLEALKVAPDTGDWHAEWRMMLQELCPEHAAYPPNVSAADQRLRIQQPIKDSFAIKLERRSREIKEGQELADELREARDQAVGRAINLRVAANHALSAANQSKFDWEQVRHLREALERDARA